MIVSICDYMDIWCLTIKHPWTEEMFANEKKELEEAERKERERLRVEWLEKQEDMKKEEIEVVYSYWDGSGHRKSVMAGTP